MSRQPFVYSGKGEICSFTTIYEGQYLPEGFEYQAPLTFALIELEEGGRVTAQITDLDPESRKKLKIGDKVEMVTRKLREDGDRGMLVYGYKFRPELIQSES